MFQVIYNFIIVMAGTCNTVFVFIQNVYMSMIVRRESPKTLYKKVRVLGKTKIRQNKKISNDQKLIQSDPTSCPQNQKGNNKIHKLTAVYERHSRKTE